MISQALFRRFTPALRFSSTYQLRMRQMKFPIQPATRSVTTPPAPIRAHDGKKFLFPERLLVYHSGARRSVFLGCLRVTTIFIFAFFSLVVAPTHWYAEDQPKWVAVGVMLSGIAPLAFVGYIAGPFVAHIHLKLPNYARYSRDVLKRYIRSLPNDSKLEITTMNYIGFPRVTRVNAMDLRPVKERFGMVNYARDTKALDTKRPWWSGRAVRQFGVHGGDKIRGNPDAWDEIVKTITRRKK